MDGDVMFIDGGACGGGKSLWKDEERRKKI